MRKLCVAGCSFSDYTKVEKTYGEILAKKLNYEYIHEGAGCGSNWRIWRKVSNHILDGILTPDDLLIIQYSNNTRNEFWSRFSNSFFENTIDSLCIVDKSYDNGTIVRYKFDSAKWQYNEEEKNFFTMYENNFINEKFEEEKFRAHNYNFQHMLKNNNINTIFLISDRINIMPPDVLVHFKNHEFHDQLTSERKLKYNLSPDDWTHMNQEGHYYLAERLYVHINNLNLI
jgi:hypothetical protein